MKRESPGHTLQTSALVNEGFCEAGGSEESAMAKPRALFLHSHANDATHPG